jgi:hypothetical protein
MSSFDFQTFLHSPSSSSVPAGGPEPISADQQEKLDELIKKFGDEGYVLEGGKLTSWEMSFLVSLKVLCVFESSRRMRGSELMRLRNRTLIRLFCDSCDGHFTMSSNDTTELHIFTALPPPSYHHHHHYYYYLPPTIPPPSPHRSLSLSLPLQPLRQSREGLLRFLRADKYDLQLCIDRIEKCLVWRRKEGMDDLEGLAKRVEGEVSSSLTRLP